MAFKTDEERLRSTIWMKTQKAGTTVNLATVRGVIDIVDEVEDVALDDLSQLGDDEFTFVDVVTTANPFALIEYFEGLNFPVHYLNRDLWIPGGVFDPNSEVLVNEDKLIEALELLRVEKNGDDDPTDGNGDDRPEYVRMIDGVPPLDVFRIHQPRRMVHIPSRFTTHEGVYIDVLPNSQDQAKLLLSQVEETVRYARDHLPKGKKAPNDEQKKAINTLRTLHNQNFPPNALARFYIDAYRNLEFIDGLVGFLRSTSQDVMVLNQSYQRAACKFSYEASPGRECVQFKGETAIPVYAQNGQDQSRRRHFD